jgi:hypothetical protein
MRHVLAGILKINAVAVLLVGVCFYVVVNYSELTQELRVRFETHADPARRRTRSMTEAA